MKNHDHFFPRTTFTVLAFFMFLSLILFNSCDKPIDRSNDISQKDIELMKENHLISLTDAVKGYDKYTKDRIKILKDTLKEKYEEKDFNDTRNVWIDIKTMKAYIQYLEDNVGETEGLQFYFSVNSNKDLGKKKDHQSFFVAPTVKNVVEGDTIQSGFTVVKGERIFLYEAFKKYSESNQNNMQKASFFSLMQDDDGYLLNRSSANPPGDNN